MMHIPQDLLDTLPPERRSEVCEDKTFACGHWVHIEQEMVAVLAPGFDDFLRGKSADEAMGSSYDS